MFNQNFLVCLVGLPASGKTTFAHALKKALHKDFKTKKVKIVDPDIIRKALTPDRFDYEKEHFIREENLKTIRSELKKGNIVISDDLNYYTSMRHDLKDITEKLNLLFIIVHIATPIHICLEWNEKRGTPIPNTVIYKIKKKFDEFHRYRWDNPEIICDLSQRDDLNHCVNDLLVKIQEKKEIMKSKAKNVVIYDKKSNMDNQKLDKYTRVYVSKLLQDSKYLPLKKKIIKLRKKFVRENRNKPFRENKLSKSFKDYLKKNLKIKITENL